MKITKENFDAYSPSIYIASAMLLCGIPRIVSKCFPGASSKGILISGIFSSALTFLFRTAPPLNIEDKKDSRFLLSSAAVCVFTIGIPFINKCYEKITKKTQIVMDGYLAIAAIQLSGISVLEVVNNAIVNPPERFIPPPRIQPLPEAKPKPKKKQTPKPQPQPRKTIDPELERQWEEAQWAPWEEAERSSRLAMEEQRRNPPPLDLPGPPPSQTYRGPMNMDDFWNK